MMPIATVGKLSSEARTGNNVPCKPWPANKIALPKRSAATGANTFLMAAISDAKSPLG